MPLVVFLVVVDEMRWCRCDKVVRPRKKEEILVVVGYTFGNCAGRLGRLLEGSRAMESS